MEHGRGMGEATIQGAPRCQTDVLTSSIPHAEQLTSWRDMTLASS